MKRNPVKWIFLILSSLWTFFVFLDYLNKHPNHILSFEHFRYGGLVIGILFIYGFHVLYNRFVNIKPLRQFMFSGIWMISCFLIVALLEFSAFSRFVLKDFDAYATSFVLYRQGTTLLGGMVFLIPAYLCGNWILNRLKINWKGRNSISDIAIGLFVIVQFIFILCTVQLYNRLSITIVLVLLSALNYKEIIPAVKMFFLISWFKNMKQDFISIAFILTGVSFAVIALTSMHLPFPLGFDSRNFYMNISKLVAEHHGLISNYQPYAWSLFISLGYVVFNNPTISLFLSFLSGLLCLAYIYHLCKNRLGLPSKQSLLAVLLFFMMPAVTNQFHTEIKIDFGLLLFQLVSLDLLLHLLNHQRLSELSIFRSSTAKKGIFQDENFRILLLFGILSGFAMTIKFTHVFFLLSAVIILWTYYLKEKGMIAAACLLFASILIFKVDEMTGLRSYHLAADIVQWIVLIAGLAMLVYPMLKERTLFLKCFLVSFIIGICTMVSFSPWLAKNYHDTRSLSPKVLLMGKTPGNPIDISEIIQNYESFQNQ